MIIDYYRQYLHRFGQVACHYCAGVEETVEHVVFDCPRFLVARDCYMRRRHVQYNLCVTVHAIQCADEERGCSHYSCHSHDASISEPMVRRPTKNLQMISLVKAGPL